MKTIKERFRRLENVVVLWSDPAVSDIKHFALIVDELGDIVGDCDFYGIEHGRGSGRAAIYDGLSIKGVGATTLVDPSKPASYTSGRLPEKAAINEACSMAFVAHLFDDAIKPMGVLSPENPVQLPMMIDGEEICLNDYVKHSNESLLVRESPDRLTHYTIPERQHETWKLLARIKESHGIASDNPFYIIFYYLYTVVYRRAYMDILRFRTNCASVDNVDIFGNCFDLAMAKNMPDYRNTSIALSSEFWITTGVFAHILCEFFKDHVLQPNESKVITAETCLAYFGDNTNLHFLSAAQDAYIYFAPILLGLSLEERNHLCRERESEYLSACTELFKYILTDTSIAEDTRAVSLGWEKHAGTNFRESLPLIVQGIEPKEAVAKIVFEKWSPLLDMLPADNDRLNRCQTAIKNRCHPMDNAVMRPTFSPECPVVYDTTTPNTSETGIRDLIDGYISSIKDLPEFSKVIDPFHIKSLVDSCREWT